MNFPQRYINKQTLSLGQNVMLKVNNGFFSQFIFNIIQLAFIFNMHTPLQTIHFFSFTQTICDCLHPNNGNVKCLVGLRLLD